MNTSCQFDSSFEYFFRKNMNSLGLPVPTGWFTSLGTAIASIKAMNNAIKLNGPNMPLSYIIRGIPVLMSSVAASEILVVAGAVTASFYVGACIGSLGVATFKTLNCNLTSSFDFQRAWKLISKSESVPSYYLELSHLKASHRAQIELGKLEDYKINSSAFS